MRRIFFTSAVAVLVCASLAAQATQSTTPSASAPSASAAANSVVVVQGCVQPSVNAVSATPDAVGTAGRSVSTATAFILTGAMKPTGTTGSNANSSSAVEPTYQLSVEDSKLIPHVGHVVEITGTLVSPDPSSTSAAAAKGASAAPTLKVENVKMMKEACTN